MNLKQFNPMKILNHWFTLKGILKNWNPPPISVEIDPSNVCNHDCVWCMFEEFKKKKPAMLPTKTMLALITELAEGGVKSVTFTGGGEPLMNPGTLDALNEAYKNGLEVGLVTNGGYLTPYVAKIAVRTCSFVRISLDAATETTHYTTHRPKNPGRDDFTTIVKNIKTLVAMRNDAKSNLTIGIAFLVHPHNYFEISSATHLAKVLGTDYIQIRPVYIAGFKPALEMRDLIEREIKRAVAMADKNFAVFPILHRFDEMSEIDRTFTRCLAHSLLGVVGADSNLYLCCQLRGDPRFSFGSLERDSFFDIWRSKQRQQVIKCINLEKCPPCRYIKYNEILDYLSDKERAHKNFL